LSEIKLWKLFASLNNLQFERYGVYISKIGSYLKSVIITGAYNVTGKSIAKDLYNQNENFEIISLDSFINEDSREDRFINLKCDISDLQQIRQVKSKIITYMRGTLFAIISCADIHQYVNSKNYYDEFDKIFQVNFFGAVYFINEFLPLFEINNNFNYKHIIVISSVSSLTGIPSNHAYTASKAALDSYVKSIARAKSSKNILVNSINPAWVNTDMLSETIDKYSDGTEDGKRQLSDKYKNQVLLKRFTEKEEDDREFKEIEKESLNFGYTDSVFILKLKCINLDTEAKQRIIVFEYPILDHIKFQTFINNKLKRTVISGDHTPFYLREVNSSFALRDLISSKMIKACFRYSRAFSTSPKARQAEPRLPKAAASARLFLSSCDNSKALW
jgi:NAD(P)-dependent dehydrogenase (short-subunit alcohol dehydrogenase family)